MQYTRHNSNDGGDSVSSFKSMTNSNLEYPDNSLDSEEEFFDADPSIEPRSRPTSPYSNPNTNKAKGFSGDIPTYSLDNMPSSENHFLGRGLPEHPSLSNDDSSSDISDDTVVQDATESDIEIPNDPVETQSGSHSSFRDSGSNKLSEKSVTMSLNDEILLSNIIFEDSSKNSFFDNTKEIKVSSNNGKSKTVNKFKNKIFLFQEFKAHQNVRINVIKLSPSGQFLATGDDNGVVKVWLIGSSLDDKDSTTNLKNINMKNKFSLLKPFIDSSKPHQVYKDHDASITDLSWSKASFLLSSSLDCTVRLFFANSPTCVKVFHHQAPVNCVDFHPIDDSYFASGSSDKKIRIWTILPKEVTKWFNPLASSVTSVAFNPDGETVAAGLATGDIFTFEFKELKYLSRIECKNRSGKYKDGSKITSISYFSQRNRPASLNNSSHNGSMGGSSHGSSHGYPVNIYSSSHGYESQRVNIGTLRRQSVPSSNYFMVSSNDSRIRICQINNRSFVEKIKGHDNYQSHIKASFSEDGSYCISGSEDGNVYIWNLNNFITNHVSNQSISNEECYKNDSYDKFQSSKNDTCVGAIFASSDSIRRFIRNQKLLNDILHKEEYKEIASVLTSNQDSHSLVSDSSSSSAYLSGLSIFEEYKHRIIITANSDGTLKVFIRLN